MDPSRRHHHRRTTKASSCNSSSNSRSQPTTPAASQQHQHHSAAGSRFIVFRRLRAHPGLAAIRHRRLHHRHHRCHSSPLCSAGHSEPNLRPYLPQHRSSQHHLLRTHHHRQRNSSLSKFLSVSQCTIQYTGHLTRLLGSTLFLEWTGCWQPWSMITLCLLQHHARQSLPHNHHHPNHCSSRRRVTFLVLGGPAAHERLLGICPPQTTRRVAALILALFFVVAFAHHAIGSKHQRHGLKNQRQGLHRGLAHPYQCRSRSGYAHVSCFSCFLSAWYGYAPWRT